MQSNSLTRLNWTDLVQLGSAPIRDITGLTGAAAGVVARIESVIGRRAHSARRRVPSAGIGYPYEIVLATEDFDALAVVDLARRNVRTADPDQFLSDADSYHCLLVGRPWLSMRKYGPRGYLYHLIDSGHALFDLALLGTEAGAPPRPITAAVRERIDGEILGIGRVCPDAAPPAHPGWKLMVTEGRQMQLSRTAFEEYALGIVPPASTAVPVTFGDARLPWAPVCLAALEDRTSASTFAPTVHPRLSQAIGDGLIWGRAMLAQLGLPEPAIAVVGAIDGAAPIPEGDLLAALAGQFHLLDAQAYLVFSIACDKAEHIDDFRRSLLLAIGVVGQALYLAAAAHGVGVTGIGGIAPEFWNCVLPPGRQSLYLMALGTAAAADKPDALMQGGHP